MTMYLKHLNGYFLFIIIYMKNEISKQNTLVKKTFNTISHEGYFFTYFVTHIQKLYEV